MTKHAREHSAVLARTGRLIVAAAQTRAWLILAGLGLAACSSATQEPDDGATSEESRQLAGDYVLASAPVPAGLSSLQLTPEGRFSAEEVGEAAFWSPRATTRTARSGAYRLSNVGGISAIELSTPDGAARTLTYSRTSDGLAFTVPGGPTFEMRADARAHEGAAHQRLACAYYDQPRAPKPRALLTIDFEGAPERATDGTFTLEQLTPAGGRSTYTGQVDTLTELSDARMLWGNDGTHGIAFTIRNDALERDAGYSRLDVALCTLGDPASCAVSMYRCSARRW